MNVIFLDIDGVLNNVYSASKSKTGCKGIDDDKVYRLKQIVDATHSQLILTSTWKTDWFPNTPIEDLPIDGQYLVNKLSKFDLHILDKTDDKEWALRGDGIVTWLHNHTNVTNFCILDDETFDYAEEELLPNFVKTKYLDPLGGLQPEHVDQAIKILSEK